MQAHTATALAVKPTAAAISHPGARYTAFPIFADVTTHLVAEPSGSNAGSDRGSA
jgi:hypothetical protein